MFRALIGAVAILAGFVVVEYSIDASTLLQNTVDLKSPGTPPPAALAGTAAARSSGR
jgi:hypothetical protein